MPQPEQSWRAFIQANFTQLALMAIVLFGIVLTVSLMHEDKIDDKYITWLEGFVVTAFSSWTLSLKSEKSDKPPAAPEKEEVKRAES